jgi:tripartite-type tricarboxylate transporter receptor subunit TctC
VPCITRRDLLAACAGTLEGAGALNRRTALAAARPATFPERGVRIVVPYSVGVGPDVVARSVAERLSQQWGQPVLVDNKPGASGIVAFSEVRRTPPDGHTLFLADTATMAVNPLLHDTLPYDPATDLVPLTLLFRATFLLFVGGAHRVHSVSELLHTARQKPNGVSYASLGNGHASHVALESFARAAGVKMLHIPYKDVGAMMSGVVSCEVDFTAVGMNTVAGLVAGGKLRPLAVAARQRLESHPLIPTLVEAGGPPVDMHPWAGLVARAGTPQGVIEALHDDLVACLGSTEVRARAAHAGFEITPSTPQALSAQAASDAAMVAPLIQEGRIARF